MQGEGWKEVVDLVTLDEAWEDSPLSPSGEIRDFPFQQALFRFLDSRAPLPGQLQQSHMLHTHTQTNTRTHTHTFSL